jgi:alpha-galactosidase
MGDRRIAAGRAIEKDRRRSTRAEKDRERTMTQIHVERIQTGAGEQTIFRRGRLEVRWGPGAELMLADITAEGTSVAGGPLVELGPSPGAPGQRVYGLGREPAAAEGQEVHEERVSDAHGPATRLERRFPVAVRPLTVVCALRLYDDLDLVRLDVRVEHGGTEPITIERAFPFVTGAWWGGALSLCGRTGDFAVYKNGWQSWSYAGGLPPGERDPRPHVPTLVAWHSPGGRSPHAPTSGAADVVSEEVALLGYSDLPDTLLAGFANADEWLGQVYLDRGAPALAACALLDGHVLRPGQSVTLPPLLLGIGPARDLLGAYAAVVGRELHARHGEPGEPTPTGWCSWYYYFTRVSEADVLENVAALRAVRATLPLRVVQIDDGYQTAVGDWTSVNERFPSGMAALAARIREAGYRPGLWLAPFTATANSRLAQEHPDWFVHDRDGAPIAAGENWNATLYGLDTSHPDARDWLRSLFRTIVAEWGYDYLKLDFLACGAISGLRHDPGATRARALCDGLALIRETVGDDVFLLGCGCPLLGGVGQLDAMRIGPDGAPYWSPRFKGIPVPLSEGHALPALEGAVRNTLTRAWMDPAWWRNDPDCLLVRRDDSDLTLDEIRAFATAVGLTGGLVLLSDRVAGLPLERLEIASKLLPPLGVRALPLDPFAPGIPERIAATVERAWGRWTLVGLFNRERRARELDVTWRELGLAPGAYHAVEFWSGTYLGAFETGVRLAVGPHGAAALRITPVAPDEPQLLGDTFHIGQGTAEVSEWRFDPERRTAAWQVRLGRQAAGAFIVGVPRGWEVGQLASTAGVVSWRRGARGELVIAAEIRDEAHFTLAFTPEHSA